MIPSNEDKIKIEIKNFINILKTVNPNVKTDYINLINGGIVNGQFTKGFINMKINILALMQQPTDSTCKALDYINNYISKLNICK